MTPASAGMALGGAQTQKKKKPYKYGDERLAVYQQRTPLCLPEIRRKDSPSPKLPSVKTQEHGTRQKLVQAITATTLGTQQDAGIQGPTKAAELKRSAYETVQPPLASKNLGMYKFPHEKAQISSIRFRTRNASFQQSQ